MKAFAVCACLVSLGLAFGQQPAEKSGFEVASIANGAGPGLDAAAAAADPAPSVAEAVRQYGLRLEARKSPVEMFIVTHVEKEPTGN